MLLLIFGLILVAASTWVVLDVATTGSRRVRDQLRRASSWSVVDRRQSQLSGTARDRLLRPLASRAAALATRLSPQASRVQLERRLHAAGVTMRPQAFLTIKGALPCAGLLLGIIGVVSGQVATLPIGLIAGMVGWIGPDIVLTRKAGARRATMSRQLPDTLDLLTVSVEAGLGFDAAIGKVCEKLDGPLIEELQLMAREIRIGESRRQALRNLADRAEEPAVMSFVRAIIQAEELGTSLGRTLRVQASDLRVKRQLAAEEQAMKAPVKMMFPTVLFIFPAMFIVILGPAVLNIMKTFSAG